jgi:hypothetical protein
MHYFEEKLLALPTNSLKNVIGTNSLATELNSSLACVFVSGKFFFQAGKKI